MSAPSLDRDDLVKWEEQLHKWEGELKARQQSLDEQEARIARARLCLKCQAALEPTPDSSGSAPDARPPPLPRVRLPALQTKTMPIPIGPSSPGSTPPSLSSPPTSPSLNARGLPPASAAASMRVGRLALSPTPPLAGRSPPSASASLRLPIRSPLPQQSVQAENKMSPSMSTPSLPGNNISAEVAAFLAEHKKTHEVVGFFPGCLLEGFLIKKGAKVKNWKRRYFVLQASGKLMYFENNDGRRLLGQLQVTSESSVGIRGNGGEGEEGGFWVCPEPNGRIYEFECGDAAMRDKWISALNSLIGPINMPRQFGKSKMSENMAPKLPTDPIPSTKKVCVIVQVPGSFFKDGEQQAMEASIYPDETVADLIRRSQQLVCLIPGLQKDKLLRPLKLANEQGEILEPQQIVYPTPVVVLQES